MAKKGVACKHQECKKIVPYSTRQVKVFCSKKCRLEHKASMKKFGGSGQFIDVSDDEILERHTYIERALMGSRKAKQILVDRWGLTSIWNPKRQMIVRL